MTDDGQANRRLAGQVVRDKRQDRLKLALRENLKRRKSQARERADFTATSSVSDDVTRDDREQGPGK
jgi:hypothetical protein